MTAPVSVTFKHVCDIFQITKDELEVRLYAILH